MYPPDYRLNVSYNASYRSNGTPNTSQIIFIPSTGPIALYIGQNIIDVAENIEIIEIYKS